MKIDKCNKILCNLYDKNNYIIHIRSLEKALDYGVILKKVHRVIQFNQGNTMENVRMHKDNKLVTRDIKKQLFSVRT